MYQQIMSIGQCFVSTLPVDSYILKNKKDSYYSSLSNSSSFNIVKSLKSSSA